MNLHFLETQTKSPDLSTRLNSYVLVCEPKTTSVTRTTHVTLKAVTCFFRPEHDTVASVSD